VIGFGLGVVGALALGRWVASLLHGVSATDPVTFAGAALVLLGTAALASWLPARRTSRIDPMLTMRGE